MEEKFEDKIKRLEEIVDKLESDKIDMDESIKLYEEGLKLSKLLTDQLKSYESKIAELQGADDEQ